jgi:hypothetical protein
MELPDPSSGLLWMASWTTLMKSETAMAVETVEAIQGSWKNVVALGEAYVGVLLFKNIFKIAPEALQMFSFKNTPVSRCTSTLIV